jgi:hypothetical protein
MANLGLSIVPFEYSESSLMNKLYMDSISPPSLVLEWTRIPMCELQSESISALYGTAILTSVTQRTCSRPTEDEMDQRTSRVPLSDMFASGLQKWHALSV